jgi:hypothetical protein
MFCPGDNCHNTEDPALLDKGIRVVFICCTVLAVIGFLWTWALVDETPHASLSRTESRYDVEPEKEGEVEALTSRVQKARGGASSDGRLGQ